MRKVFIIMFVFILTALYASCGNSSVEAPTSTSTSTSVVSQTTQSASITTEHSTAVFDADEVDAALLANEADEDDNGGAAIDAVEEKTDAEYIDENDAGSNTEDNGEDEDEDEVEVDVSEEVAEAEIDPKDDEEALTPVVINGEEVLVPSELAERDDITIVWVDDDYYYVNDNEKDADGVYRYIHEPAWFIDANFSHQFDAGIWYGQSSQASAPVPGIIANYAFNLHLSHVGHDPAGLYYLTFDSEVEFNSDAAFDKMLSDYLGGGISGMGLGLNGHSYAHIQPDDAPLTVSELPWDTAVKDSEGATVTLVGTNYFLDETLTIPYKTDTADSVWGNFPGGLDETVRLFISFAASDDPAAYDFSDNEIVYEHLAFIYITYPKRTAEGAEMWHSGEGTVQMRTYYSYVIPKIAIE